MLRKKLLLIGLCVALATVSLVVAFWRLSPLLVNPQAPVSLRDESLTFLEDIIGLDMTKYEVVNIEFAPQIDVVSRNGLPLYLTRYYLKASDDEGFVNIMYTKANDTYIHEYFSLYSHTLFSPAYPTSKVLNWTKSFLERYQSFRNDASYISQIRNLLESIDHIQPLNVTRDDIKLQITIKEFSEKEIYTTLKFSPVNSTTRDYENAVTFEFHNGVWLAFWDWYDYSYD